MKNLYYDIKNGIYGLYYWALFAWKWRSWDYAYGLLALQHHLEALEVAVREGYHVRGEADARDIRVAIELLKRQYGMYYYSKGGLDIVEIRRLQKKEQEDWNYLFKLMRKRMKYWWD